MKFVHIADIHLDSVLMNLNRINNLSDIRRLEQREAIKKVIEYIKENKISYLFISGDLYEHEYVKQSTIEYINNLFKEIPETKIFISPGNHDPYLKNSYYNEFNWNNNVYIFSGDIERVELDGIDIYGNAFTDFYCRNSNIQNIKIENKNKINILITHGSLDGGCDNYREYNPLSQKVLKEFGFDYIALGHIHKNNINTNKNIIYPGSLVSLGFDEPGEHGMVIGEINKDGIKLEFKKIDTREYEVRQLDISKIISEEELVENLNSIKDSTKNLYEIELVGYRNFEIDKYHIYKILENNQIIKIKNSTKIPYDLESISKENNLKGIFIRELLKKKQLGNISQETIEKAIEIGLDAIDG